MPLEVIEKMERETGVRTRDVQLGKLPVICKYKTYASRVLVLGHLTH